MDSTNNRIVYIQGFLQAYGLDKEASWEDGTTDPALPAPAFLNSQARKKVFKGGLNLNFENPSVRKYTTKYAPNKAKFLSRPFTGPKTWRQKTLAKLYPGIRKLPGSRAFLSTAIGQRAAKSLYVSSPQARKDIQAKANKTLKAGLAPYVKGALGAAAVGIPAMAMMGMMGGSRQQAAPDPRLTELARHAAAMKPGAVYRRGKGNTEREDIVMDADYFSRKPWELYRQGNSIDGRD